MKFEKEIRLSSRCACRSVNCPPPSPFYPPPCKFQPGDTTLRQRGRWSTRGRWQRAHKLISCFPFEAPTIPWSSKLPRFPSDKWIIENDGNQISSIKMISRARVNFSSFAEKQEINLYDIARTKCLANTAFRWLADDSLITRASRSAICSECDRYLRASLGIKIERFILKESASEENEFCSRWKCRGKK